MNYEYLKTFYIVSKYQNFSKAANILYTSQPAISRVISNLESELGVKLFTRTKAGVLLTKEGENLFTSIEPSFRYLERIENEIANNSLMGNNIHIGATVTALHCFLFDFFKKLEKKFPNLHYRIYTGSSSKILSLLESGIIDIGFVTTPFDLKDDIQINNIAEIENILVAGNIFKNELKEEMSIKDLINYPFILLSIDMQFRTHINEFLSKNDVKIKPVIEADSSDILMPLVEHNYGISFVPKNMAKDGIEKNLAFEVKLKEKIPPRYISYITNKKYPESSIIKDIKKFINDNK